MTQLIVDIGVQGNDGTGDSIRESFRKVNSNFNELYAIFGAGGTIKFTSLSDAPSDYGTNKVIMSSGTGTSLTARALVGGSGVTIDTSTNSSVTISATANLLINQTTPSLGQSLNANLFTIGRLSDPSPLLVSQFNAAYASLGVQTTLAQLAVTKGYADSHYVQATNGVVTGAFKPRNQPATPQTSDPDYDATLTSNYVSTEAMQRKDVVYRGGDAMTGALTLSDHPSPLAGAGTPNGSSDLQAATKYYVDNNSYSSNVNLFVSTTSGDDAQTKTPAGKEGRYWQYAYKTVGAAALQASNLIDLAGIEPGPYKQRLAWTSTSGNQTQVFSTIQSITLTGGNSATAGYQDAADLLEANKSFIQNETIAYLNKKYVNTFTLDTVAYSSIIGSIIDGVGYDLVFGTTHNSASVAGTLFNTANANIITNQLTQLTDGIDYANKIISTYSYNISNTQNYIGAVLDAIGYDLVFGDNYQSIQVALSFGSYNTGLTNAEIVAALGDMVHTISGLSSITNSSTIITSLQTILSTIDNIITTGVVPSVSLPDQNGTTNGKKNAKNLLLNNIPFIQAEINAYLKSNYPDLIYNTSAYQRNVKYTVYSIIYDFMYGGNSQSVYNGLQYWRNNNFTNSEKTATVAAINYINTLAQAVVTSSAPAITYQTSFLQYTNTTLTGGGTVSTSVSTNIATISGIVASSSTPTPSITLPTVPSSGALHDAREQIVATLEKNTLKSAAITYINTNGSFSIINNDTINTTINNLFSLITNVLTNGIGTRSTPTYNSPGTLASTYTHARLAAIANLSFLAEETYAWALTQYPSFDPADGVAYFKRHMQYLVEAACYDITYGGNLASIYASSQYRTNGASVLSSGELAIQVAAIGYLQDILTSVISDIAVSPVYQNTVTQTRNTLYADGSAASTDINNLFNSMVAYIGYNNDITPTAPSLTGYDSNALLARNILVANKSSIVNATNSYLSATYKGGFSYNETTCYRDVGYIIDAMAIDILTGGNYQTVNAGKSYYKNASAKSIAIGTQLSQTVDGIAFAKALGIQVLNQTVRTRFQDLVPQVFSTGLNIGVTYTAIANGTSITVTFASQSSTLFANNSIVYLSGFSPANYNGLFTVTGCTNSSVTVASTIAAGSATNMGQIKTVAPSAGAINTFTGNMTTVLNIITNGLGAVPTATFGTGIYNINFDNGGNGYVDQGAPGDVHIIPAKILLGATSGAGGVIVKYLPNNLSGQDTLQIRLTRPGFFRVGEELDFGETVKDLNITIFVESGVYYEDYPIRLPANCSIKGDEFRRTIMRPLDRVSLSPWRKIFFFRDSVIDANLIGLVNYTTDYASNSTLTISGTNNTIIATLGTGQAQQNYIGKLLIDNAQGMAVVTSISGNTLNCTVIYQFAAKTTYTSGNWHLYGTYDYGRHYLSNPLDINSAALNNKLMDVLLCNDATRVSNMTFQGHGGFAMVLDPEGQVKTKSPYGQVCSSFTQSTNSKRFAGGQFVDGFAGRLFGNVTGVTDNGITITVTGGVNSGLDIRAPQIPCVYYVQGNRYQVNDIVSYTQNTDGSGNVISGTVVLTIDVSTPFDTATFYRTVAVGSSIPSFSGDMANKIDALTYDLVFGSNYKTITSGLYYLQSANQVAGIQQLFLQSGITKTASLMNAVTSTVLSGTNASSAGGTATITFATQVSAPYQVGASILVSGFTPNNFNGTFTVTNCSTTSVQFALTGTYTQTGLGTVTGVVSPGSQTSISANAVTINNIIVNGLQAVPTLTFPIPTGTSTNISNAVAILIANKAFIRSEISAWLSANYSTRAIFNYNAVTFSRNFGYFVDALTYDLLYGGNSSVYDNAQTYWVNSVSQILGQESYYTAALVRLGTILTQVVQNQTVTVSAGNLLSQTTNLSAASSSEATTLTTLNNILLDYVADGSFNGVATGTVRTNPTLPANASYNLVKNDRSIIQGAKTTIQSSAVTFLNSGANISINIEMGGNRSMLANDFAMINDLGYAIIATNGAASEQVSTFSYYCHTHYWSNNGGQIRSIGGSNAHGNYGMRATGYDVTELPNAVNLAYDMVQVARVYKQGLFASLMTPTASTQALSVYITGWEYIPPNNAELEIDHTAAGGVITRYLVSTVSHTVVTINGQNVLQINLSTAGTNSTVTTGLAYALYDGQQVILRVNQNIKFYNISNVKPTRPSTAVQYADNLGDIYRIIAYNLTDSTGEPLPANTAILQADASFNYYKFTIDTTNITQLDPSDSTKTQGSKVGDNKIAVLQISLQSTIDQVNKGIFITGWGGRVHRIVGYTAPTFIATGLYSTYTSTNGYTLVVTNVSGNILQGQIVTGTGFDGTQTVSSVSLSGTSTITATVTLSAAATGTPSGTITFGVAKNGYITIDPNSVYNNSADGTGVSALTYASKAAGPTGTTYTAVTFNVPFKTALPLSDSYLTVTGQANNNYNGTYQILSVVNQTQITVSSVAGLSVGMIVTSPSAVTVTNVVSTGNGVFTFTSINSITITTGMTVTVTGTINGIAWTGYTTGTTYGISATNGASEFTLVTTSGASLSITSGTPSGLVFVINTTAVVQNSTIIQSINAVNNTFIVSPACWLPSGASVTSTLVATLSGISITNAGTQYGSGIAPTITITGGGAINQAIATCTVLNGSIATVTVVSPGYGYVSNPTITVSYGDAVLTPVLSSNPTTNSVINAGIITTQVTLAYPTDPGSFTAGTTTTVTGFNGTTGYGPYLANVNLTLTSIPAAGTNYLVANNSNPLYNGYVPIAGIYSTTASATDGATNRVTLASTTGMTTGMPIQFSANSIQTTTLTATGGDGTSGILTVSSTTGLTLGRSIIFTAVTQSDLLTATTASGNLLTLSTVSGLIVGEPIVFTSVTQTPTLVATTAAGGLLSLSSTTGLVVNQPIVFTAVTQTPTVISTASSDNSVTLSGTAGLSIGSSFIPTAVTSTTATLTSISASGNLATLSSTSGLVVGESIIFTAVSQTTLLSATNTSTASATTGIVGNGALSAAAGTVFTPTGNVTGTFAVGMVLTGGALTATSGVYITAVNSALFTGTVSGTTLTVTNVSSGTLRVGMVITGTSVTAGSYIVAFGTGSGGNGNYTLNQSTTGTPTTGTSYTVSTSVLQGSTTINGANNLITVASTAGMAVGEWFTVASNVGNLLSLTNYYITQLLANGTQLAVSTNYGGANVTLANTSGSVSVTAGGQMGGVISGTTYYIASIAGNQVTLSTSPTLSPVTTLTQTNSGTSGWTSVAGSVLGGLTSGTTYYVVTISSPKVTLSTSATLTPTVTLTNGAAGTSAWTSLTNSIFGGINSGNTYYIAGINGNQITVSSSFGTGAISVTNGAGSWTSVAGGTLGGVQSGTTYYVKTISGGTNQITVATDAALVNTLSVSNSAGAWTGSGGGSFGGVQSGTTYYLVGISTNTISISTSPTLFPILSTTQATGNWTAVSGTVLGGITSGNIYYVASIAGNQVTLSSSNTLSPQTVLQSAGISASVNAGPITSMTLSYPYNPGVWGIQITYLSSGSGNVTVSFATQSNSPGVNTNIVVSGFTPSGYNGPATITAVGSTSSTFVGYISGTSLTITNLTTGTVVLGQIITSSTSSIIGGTYITAFVSGVNGGAGVYTISNGQTVGNVSSLVTMIGASSTISFANATNTAVTVFGQFTTVTTVTNENSNGTSTQLGIAKPFNVSTAATLRLGYPAAEGAQITTRISTCRATSHDFLNIGTGSYTTTNWPTVIYGNPAKSAQQSQEILEEGVGRVFYVSTDQNGIFRVGRFFTVDQGTGSVTFSASIALSNLDGLGFKRGVVVSEFSTDTGMTNNASDTVSVQSAVRGYIDRRLGLDHGGSPVALTNLIGYGYLSLGGGLAMKGSLNMAGYTISNVGTPVIGTDGVNKSYVDAGLQNVGRLSTLTDAQIAGLANAQLLVYDGTLAKWRNAVATTGDVAVSFNSVTGVISHAINTGVIVNSQVSASAAIAQSKLSLTAAGTRANATSITQADLGVASFDSSQFTSTNGWITHLTSTSAITGIPLSKIQYISNGTILGNLGASFASPTTVTPSQVVTAAGGIINSNFSTSGAMIVTYDGTSTANNTYSAITVTSAGGNGLNSLLRTGASKEIDVGFIKIGSYKSIYLNSTTLTFTTPGGFDYMTATGGNSTNTVISTLGTLDTSGGTLKSTLFTTGGSSATGQVIGNWSVQASSVWDVTLATLKSLTLDAGSETTDATVRGRWSLTGASRMQATYADLAEYYEGDQEYEPGTVLVFGGDKEVTTTTQINDTRSAGVVTTNPAYIMNSEQTGIKVCIALAGRVPCRVVGRVKKGDMLTTSATPGHAVKALSPTLGAVIGKALEDKDYGEAGVIQVAVGRV
jgi:hypothetical protein